MTDNYRPSFQIEKLNNNNYAVWKFRVKQMLINLEVWSVVVEEAPENPDAAWKKKNDYAFSTISLLVDDNQLTHIINAKSAKEVWKALEDYHQKSSESSIVHLYRTLCRMRLSEDGDMEDHINNVQDTVNRLNVLGEEIRDKFAAAILLESLPDSYDPLVTMLEEREEGFSLSLAKSKLIDEYKRRKNTKVQVTSGGECYFCKKKGHFKQECEKYIAWKQNKAKVFNTSGTMKDNYWIMDSGATSHMCNNRDFFENLNCEKKGKVKFADTKAEYTGIGSGTLRFINAGKEIAINVTDVLYVPKLRSSLLSVTKLLEKGFSVQFENSVCRVIDPTDGEVKTTAIMTKNKEFELQTKESVHRVIKIKEDKGVSNSRNVITGKQRIKVRIFGRQ